MRAEIVRQMIVWIVPFLIAGLAVKGYMASISPDGRAETKPQAWSAIAIFAFVWFITFGGLRTLLTNSN